MPRRDELQGEQWALIGPLLPNVASRADGRGRPRMTCERQAAEVDLRRRTRRPGWRSVSFRTANSLPIIVLPRSSGR